MLAGSSPLGEVRAGAGLETGFVYFSMGALDPGDTFLGNITNDDALGKSPLHPGRLALGLMYGTVPLPPLADVFRGNGKFWGNSAVRTLRGRQFRLLRAVFGGDLFRPDGYIKTGKDNHTAKSGG